MWRDGCIGVIDMSVTSTKQPADRHEMSHVAMAALAGAVVVIAALVLVYVSRHAHQHPGAALVAILGIPALIALAIVIVRRRGAR